MTDYPAIAPGGANTTPYPVVIVPPDQDEAALLIVQARAAAAQPASDPVAEGEASG